MGYEVFAIGSGKMHRYRGDINASGNFTFDELTQPGPGTALFGVWGSSPDNVWVVGNKGTVLHSTGWPGWLPPAGLLLPTTYTLVDISGSGPNDIWIIGTDQGPPNRTVVLHWTGQAPIQTFAPVVPDALGRVVVTGPARHLAAPHKRHCSLRLPRRRQGRLHAGGDWGQLADSGPGRKRHRGSVGDGWQGHAPAPQASVS